MTEPVSVDLNRSVALSGTAVEAAGRAHSCTPRADRRRRAANTRVAAPAS